MSEAASRSDLRRLATTDPGGLTSVEKRFDQDAARGMLVGLAVGDAIGTAVEFKPRGSFSAVTDMVGGGPFDLKPGQWTDDTAMALCLADSLLAHGGWDAADCMTRFVNWFHWGLNSATGDCFDIGLQTRDALQSYERTGNPYAGPSDELKSGNGGIMRLAPVVLAYGTDADRAAGYARDQSRLTHGSPTCRAAAADMARVLVTGNRNVLPEPEVPPAEASGYVVHSLQAAYWALARSDSFEDAILSAVNLGGDADTVGAITGQFAGRFYGHDAIPGRWRSRLAWHEHIVDLSDRLWALMPRDPA